MIFTFLLSLQVANAPLPQPLTETHMRDIGCVATLGLIASDQRRGMAPSIRFPNVMERGKKYAGIVGERVIAETGQSREVVRLAIMQSVEDQQDRAITTDEAGGDAKAMFGELMDTCVPLLDAEVPVEAPTQEDYLFCAAIIGLAADEIEGREGAESMNAKAMRKLVEQLEEKYYAAVDPNLPVDSAGFGTAQAAAAADLVGEMEKQSALAKSGGGVEALSEAEGEEKYQRCIFLGE